MSTTTKNHVTSIYSAYMEIASEKASPRSRGAAMIQDKTLKTKNPKCCPAALMSTKGYPFLSLFHCNALSPVSRKPTLGGLLLYTVGCTLMYNPTAFSCNPKDSEKRGVVLHKTKVFRLQSIYLNEKYSKDILCD